MEHDAKGQERSSLEPEDALALLRAQAAESHKITDQAEALSERRSGEVAPRRLLIGLISCLLPISDLSHPVFEGLLVGMRGRLTASDCDLLISATHSLETAANLRRAAAEQAIERGLDGLIVWAIADNDPEFEPIIASNLPAIFVDNQVFADRTGSVMSDNVNAMIEVVHHLYSTGRRRVAHISGHYNTRPGTDRLLGFKAEIEALGLPLPPEYIEEGDFFHESGYTAAKRLIALADPPDAITCASDAMAIGAMAAIAESGLRVPEDIAVTGFDDAAFASTVRPALTTVRQDVVAMGTTSAEAVLRMLEYPDNPPPVVLVPTELVIRESSGPAQGN